MKLFGTEEPVSETPVLRAGPLECSLDAGNLRHIRLHGVEAIRAVSYLVRDRNWGTYNPEITQPANRAGPKRASGSPSTRSARDAQQAFAYRARIEADAAGNLSFAAEGEALSDFLTNRTGFVVLPSGLLDISLPGRNELDLLKGAEGWMAAAAGAGLEWP